VDRMKRAKPDILVMHPGPINRGVEMESEVADGANSVILEQVTNGLAVRMAVLFLVNQAAHRRTDYRGIIYEFESLIRNGRVIDPTNRIDKKCDVLIVDEKIAQVGRAR